MKDRDMEQKQATVYGGRTVTVGDRVVYPGRQSSSLFINEGTIVDIVDNAGWNSNQTALKVRRPTKSFKLVDGEYQHVHGEKVVTITETQRVIPFNG
jgi:hypothetical protein